MWKLLVPLMYFQLSTSLAAPNLSSSPSIITPQLKNAFLENGVANIFISFKSNTSAVLNAITGAKFQTRSSKLNALYSALREHSATTQQRILDFLSSHISQASEVKSFWISNQIYVKNAEQSLVTDLASHFSDVISVIDEEFYAHLIEPVSIQTNVSLKLNGEELQWGVKKIQAREAWEELGGILNTGRGIIVATIDTGVRGTHEALRNNFAGDYGWFDPSGESEIPTDNNGHGTHTMGTIVGGRGIGVAPMVKWAACRGCPGVFCFQSHLLACGEFFTCPTLPDGSNPDCSRAPNLISNSWGGGRGNTWYNGVIQVWKAAGIIPLFSIGNSGPICSTPSSPGDQDVIAVGSTMVNDAISLFSSVGPTMDGRIKPEISAPGSDILSAYHTADDAYAIISGTSQSCPHAAGTVALLQMRNQELTYEEAKDLLVRNTDQNLRFSGRVCNGIRDNIFPNHVFGNGRINALKSIQAQTVGLMYQQKL